ncbi:MAG: MFS transporter [Lactobacillus sp.]|nr:MFS transporter [Lactobacillus sp.]
MEQTSNHVGQAMTKNQKWVLASTASGFSLENMDIMFLSFALAPIIASLYISSTAAGWIGSITNLGMLAGGAIFGLVGDRIGRVKTFTYTIFIFALATAAMFFAHSLPAIYLCRFLAGIGAGGEYGVGIALIAENFEPHLIGRLTSVAAIGGQVGAIFAAIMAAYIIPHFGWNDLFLLGIIPVILTFFIRRHVHESQEFIVAHQKTIVQIAGYFGLMNWLPSIVQKQQGLSVSGSSIWMIATIVGMSIGMLVFGTVMDNWGPRWAFGIFLLGSATVMFTILMVQSSLALILAGALIGFFSNGMFGGYGAVISQLYPTAIRSTANSIIMNVGRAIGGFSSVVIGLLMDHYSLGVTMGFLSALYILSFIVMSSLPGMRKLANNH